MAVNDGVARERGPSSDLLALVSGRVSERTKQLLSLYLLGSTGLRGLQTLRAKLRSSTTFTVAVGGDDEIYDELHAWLLEQMLPEQQHAVKARVGRVSSSYEDAPVARDDRPAPKRVMLTYDGERVQTVSIDGFAVKVEVTRESSGNVDLTTDSRRSWDELRRAMVRMQFTCESVAARNAVLAMIERIAAARARSDRLPTLRVADRWGNWNRMTELQYRSFDTVILEHDLRETIVDDLGSFLSREADYGRLGIPWHRGYLFHGPPGTGKTSIAKALANQFKLDVYYLPLADLNDDASLLGLIRSVDPRSMLLLEDVDAFGAARERDATQPGATTSGLLNALDGVATPHGLITVMTTNHVDSIDEALLRRGRVDRSVEVGLMQPEQMARLVEVFTGFSTQPSSWKPDLSPADVVEVVKRHLGAERLALSRLREQFGN